MSSNTDKLFLKYETAASFAPVQSKQIVLLLRLSEGRCMVRGDCNRRERKRERERERGGEREDELDYEGC